MYYARAPDVIVRREHFGGIAFNKRNGKLVEVDREACRLLELADGKMGLWNLVNTIETELNTNVNRSEIHQLVTLLRSNGFLVKNTESVPINLKPWPERTRHLSAPETVHLALTHRCNYHCQSCYIDTRTTKEMTTSEIEALIEEMAEMKVFQLAIGGGEPFLREDLIEIVKYANQCGIVSNITTNGSLITPKNVAQLSDCIGQIQLSVNGPSKKHHEANRQINSFKTVLKAIEVLQTQKIRFGMNILLCQDNLQNIQNLIQFGVEKGASTLNFIRPKPSKQNQIWYAKSRLSTEDYRTLSLALQDAVCKYPSIRVTIDCAFSFLMNKETPTSLQKRGVHGCAGAVRFISIHPNGDVYPCSFLATPQFYGGNAITDGLTKIWHDRFHELRANPARLTGKCRLCRTKTFCMGCRAIALHETGTIYSDDPGCFQLSP
jgi:radical SAM protein with 4Fe4S-binding SPASM domain